MTRSTGPWMAPRQPCRECSALRAEVERLQERLADMIRTRTAFLIAVERHEDALWSIAAGGCAYTGVVAGDLPCYRRTDCDDLCPACRARAALDVEES